MFPYGQGLSKSYDLDYRVQSVVSPALSLAFYLDAVGNIRSSGATAGLWEESYDYDGLYRLTDVLDGSGGTMLDSFSYDATGNRMSRERRGEQEVLYTYPVDSHRLTAVGGVDRSYDSMGNTTEGIRFQASLLYGDHGRLIAWSQARVGERHYLYNGRGERVAKIDPDGSCPDACQGSLFVYDESGRLIGEYGLDGKLIQEHVWIDDTPVAVLREEGIYTVHGDHLNTPRAITDASGNLRWRWIFQGNAFGEAMAEDDPFVIGPFEYNLRFPGQYFDVESGLHYNYFRDYDPSSGRYVQSDPIGLHGGINTFAYAGGNPLLYMDPLGLAHTSGRWVDCGGGCRIRIDGNHSGDGRHLHWECKGGRSGEMGEFGGVSHGGTWEDAPRKVRDCARRNGFVPEPREDQQQSCGTGECMTTTQVVATTVGVGVGAYVVYRVIKVCVLTFVGGPVGFAVGVATP